MTTPYADQLIELLEESGGTLRGNPYSINLTLPGTKEVIELTFVQDTNPINDYTGVMVGVSRGGKPVNLYTGVSDASKIVRTVLGASGLKLVWDKDMGMSRLYAKTNLNKTELRNLLNAKNEADVEAAFTQSSETALTLVNDPNTPVDLRNDIRYTISLDPAFYAILMAVRDALNNNATGLSDILAVLKKPVTKERKLKELLEKLPNPAARQQVMSNIRSITGEAFAGYITDADIQEAKDVGLLTDVSTTPELYSNTIYSMDHAYKLSKRKPPTPVVERQKRILLR